MRNKSKTKQKADEFLRDWRIILKKLNKLVVEFQNWKSKTHELCEKLQIKKVNNQQQLNHWLANILKIEIAETTFDWTHKNQTTQEKDERYLSGNTISFFIQFFILLLLLPVCRRWNSRQQFILSTLNGEQQERAIMFTTPIYRDNTLISSISDASTLLPLQKRQHNGCVCVCLCMCVFLASPSCFDFVFFSHALSLC